MAGVESANACRQGLVIDCLKPCDFAWRSWTFRLCGCGGG